jgi:hypothetical protein
MRTMTSRTLTIAMALSAALGAHAWAHDFSNFDCTGKDFIVAYIDAMNTSDKFKNAGLKVVSITDPENVEATADQLTCTGVFEFASGEKLAETFILKDGADGHLAWSYKPTK